LGSKAESGIIKHTHLLLSNLSSISNLGFPLLLGPLLSLDLPGLLLVRPVCILGTEVFISERLNCLPLFLLFLLQLGTLIAELVQVGETKFANSLV
jgi:hypothetical protein